MTEQRTLDLLKMDHTAVEKLVEKMIEDRMGDEPDDIEFRVFDYFIVDSRTIIVKVDEIVHRYYIDDDDEMVRIIEKMEFTIKARLSDDGELVPVEVS